MRGVLDVLLGFGDLWDLWDLHDLRVLLEELRI